MPNLLFENRLQRIQSLVDPLNGLFKRFIARVLRFVHLFALPHAPKERLWPEAHGGRYRRVGHLQNDPVPPPFCPISPTAAAGLVSNRQRASES